MSRLGKNLVRLMPREIRDEYGEDLAAVVDRSLREQRQRSQWRSLRCMFQTTSDFLRTAVAARLRRFSSGGGGREPMPARSPRGAGSLDGMLQDLRFGIRLLKRMPGTSSVAILIIAMSVGTATAIFGIVDSVLLRTLPFSEPERVVQVFKLTPPPNVSWFAVSPADFLDWREQVDGFAEIAAISGTRRNLGGGDRPVRIGAAYVSWNLFRLLGVEAAVGRTFREEEGYPTPREVVVISDRLWRSHFGGRTDAIGSELLVNGAAVTLIGVLPGDFVLPGRWDTDIYATNPFRSDGPTERSVHRLRAIARLAPGVTMSQAREQLQAIHAEIEKAAVADPDRRMGADLALLLEFHTRDVREPLFLLFGVAAFVLAIAAVNVANLLANLTIARRRELALRGALGAGGARLIRQLMVEGMLFAVIGALLGLPIAWWATRATVALAVEQMPILEQAAFDGRVFAIGMLTALGLAMVSTILPAVRVGGMAPDRLLRRAEGRRGRLAPGQARALLAAMQAAMALVLLIGLALMLASFAEVLRLPLGFDPDGVHVLDTTMPRQTYAAESGFGSSEWTTSTVVWNVHPRQKRVVEEVVTRLNALPEVGAAGATNYLPSTGGLSWFLRVPGRSATVNLRDIEVTSADGRRPDVARYRPATPGYLEALGVPLIAGRAFSTEDRQGAPPVAILNRTAAQSFFGDPRRAIGQEVLARPGREGALKPIRIVGVVDDVWEWGFQQFGLNASDRATVMYVPYDQQPDAFLDFQIAFRLEVSFAARFHPGQEEAALASMQAIFAEAAPDLPVDELRSMDDFLGWLMTERRFMTRLIGSFAAVGLMIALIGVYGVIAFQVRRQFHEMGVRMALGARAGDVLGLVLRNGFRIGLLGVLLGILGAMWATPLLESWLFRVSQREPFVFLAAGGLMLLTVLVATYIPARRAAALDPVDVLRAD